MASSSSNISSSCSSISYPIAESVPSQSSSFASRTYSHPPSFPNHELPNEVWLHIIAYAVCCREEDPSLNSRTLSALRASGKFFTDLVDNDMLGQFWKILAINRPCPCFKQLILEASNNAYAALQPDEQSPSYLSRFAHLTESFTRRGIALQEGCPIWFQPSQFDAAMKIFDVNLERAWFARGAQNPLEVNNRWFANAPYINVQEIANAQEMRAMLYDPTQQEYIQSISYVHFDYLNLTVIPPEIGFFTGLRMVGLKNNSLKVLPPEIGNLTRLRVIFATKNELTTLPPEIGRLTQLGTLELEGNAEFKTLPSEIVHLPNLWQINLLGTHLKNTRFEGVSPEILEFLGRCNTGGYEFGPR